MSRNLRTLSGFAIVLTITLSTFGAVVVRGQGGTGREPAAPPPKKTTTTKTAPARKTTRSTTSGSKTLPRTRTNQAGIEFVLIPAGRFMMGSPNGASEMDVHVVAISQPFFMSKYEVTQGLYRTDPQNYARRIALNGGQSRVTGALKGKVVNSQTGEPVVGASVQIINLDSMVPMATLTDADGYFIRNSLQPGRYKVVVKAQNFKHYESDKVQRIDIAVTSNVFPFPISLEPLRPAQPSSAPPMSKTNGENEKPVHGVTINYSFYMGKYEVTQAQWQSVMGNNPASFKDCGGNCPVEQVSWEDAQSFIDKLNENNDGFRYRLPTEAEWEYACRAGTTGDYASSLSLASMGWYENHSGGHTHAVGQLSPNSFGLYDMHGNVWEWCQDWYHETYYGAPTDGSAWLSGGEQKFRVLRGGSWNDLATNLRSANRLKSAPDFRLVTFGFRLVAVVRTQ